MDSAKIVGEHLHPVLESCVDLSISNLNFEI